MTFNSKLLISTLVGMSLLVSLSACDRFLRGGAAPAKTIKVPTEQLACLSVVPKLAKAYFSDALNETKTRQMFACIDGAVDMFNKYGGGQNPNQFTSEELRLFFNRYMLTNEQISVSFMVQIMKAKALLLGGNNSSMTKDELARAHQLFSLLSDEAARLRGQWKTLLFASDRATLSADELARANELAQSALANIITFSAAESSGYAWSDFKALLSEVESFLDAKDLLINLNKWMPLTDAVRQLFLGTSFNLSTKAGWLETGKWTADVYYLMAQVFYRMQGIKLESAKVWNPLIHLIDSGLELLEQSPQFQKQKILRNVDLDNVVDELEKLKICPMNIPGPVLKETYRHFFAVFKQGQALAGSESYNWLRVEGFDVDMLEHLKLEYQIWKLGQLQIAQLFEQVDSKPLLDVVDHWKTLDVQSIGHTWNLDSANIPLLMRSWSDWLSILKKPQSLVFEPGGNLIIPSVPEHTTANAASLTILNGLRSFVRLIEMGYGQKHSAQADIWDGFMTQETVTQWEQDLQDLGQSIQFLDPLQNDSAVRFYTDSRFFTFSSLGGPEINSQQMLELVSLMISGGKIVADQFMSYLAADHCLTNAKDPSFLKPLSDKKCFEKSLKLHFTQLFANLPGLANEVKSGRLSLEEAMPSIEAIALDSFKKNHEVMEYGEYRALGGVLHYIEALMQVYDTNHDQKLSLNELVAAFPRFQSVVEQISPMGKWLTEDAFLYIVYRGKMPDTKGIGKFISTSSDFAFFVTQRQLGSAPGGLGSVSRLNLLKVIAILKQSTSSAAKAASQQNTK